MRKKGSGFEYTKERDADLMRAYRCQLSKCEHINLSEVLRKTVDSPSKRFWVSEKRAVTVVRNMISGGAPSVKALRQQPMKAEMFKDIRDRAVLYLDEHPHEALSEAVSYVLENGAPKFYLTPESAKVIICNIKKKWYYENRKRLLRHLF